MVLTGIPLPFSRLNDVRGGGAVLLQLHLGQPFAERPCDRVIGITASTSRRGAGD